MSSSIDYFDCPRCGASAFREQDNRTCEITCGCSKCDWKGETVDTTQIQAYQKVTIGFVVQNYMMNKQGKYICIEQSFEAGEQVTREDNNGDHLEIDTTKEVYQPMEMLQPRESDFEQWYAKNKNNDNLIYDFKDTIMKNPDYPLCFRDWCRLYYKEHVEI